MWSNSHQTSMVNSSERGYEQTNVELLKSKSKGKLLIQDSRRVNDSVP